MYNNDIVINGNRNFSRVTLYNLYIYYKAKKCPVIVMIIVYVML